jgi:hypothetical protein
VQGAPFAAPGAVDQTEIAGRDDFSNRRERGFTRRARNRLGVIQGFIINW